MRTEPARLHRVLATAALVTATITAAAQDAAPAADQPLIPVSGTVNYVMMGLAVVQVVLILAMSSILRTMMGSTGWMRKLTERHSKAAVLLPFLLLAGGAQAQAYVEPTTTMRPTELVFPSMAVDV